MKPPLLLTCLALCAAILAACAAPAATPPTVAPSPAPTATVVPPSTAAPTPTQPPPTISPGAPTEPLAVSPVGQDGTLVMGTSGQPWWNDTTFYEIFVRSFYDSDGDGIGDLNGLIGKLDYLNDGDPTITSDPSTSSGHDLGVTGIWLMPIMASPSYHGYDVTDYYQVNPEYGTNEDFKRLIEDAHKRGIRVIIDLVLNHTSAEHPWFIESQEPGSPKRDWYVWSNEEPQGKGWHPGKNGGYYYGYFGEHMPDLNYKNPAVTEEMYKVVRFWLEQMGADGFRLDAVKYLYEDGKRIEHTPATHEWLKDFNKFYKGIAPQAFTVGEVWDDSGTAAKYVGDELDATFDFGLAEGDDPECSGRQASQRRTSGADHNRRLSRRASSPPSWPTTTRTGRARGCWTKGRRRPLPRFSSRSAACRSSIMAKRSACRARSPTRTSAGPCSGRPRAGSRPVRPGTATTRTTGSATSPARTPTRTPS